MKGGMRCYLPRKVDMICDKCNTVNNDNAKFCKRCGNALVHVQEHGNVGKRCPNCGIEVSETATFCKRCGYKLDESDQSSYSGYEGEQTVFLEQGNMSGHQFNKQEARGENADNRQVYEGHYTRYDIISEDQLPPQYKPIGAWAYFGWMLLFSIPVVGIILALVFALGSTENINLRNFARSMFCFMLVLAAISLLIMGSAGCTLGMML